MTGRESQWKGIGQWQKGNWQGFVNPLLKNHKPQIVRLAHRSSEPHRCCLWKVPARKLHLRGCLWKSGSGLDWCPTPSGRGWEETAYNEISEGPGDGEPLLWLTLVSQSDGKRSWETEEEDGMLRREEVGRGTLYSVRDCQGLPPSVTGPPLAITHRLFRNSSPPSSRWIIHSSGCLKWALTLRSKLPLEESLCLRVGSPWAKPMPESRTDPPVVGELGLLLETFRAFWVAFSSCLSVVPFGARLPELHFQPSRVASHSIISFLRASWLMTHIYSFSPTQICLTDVSFPWRLGREKCVLRC